MPKSLPTVYEAYEFSAEEATLAFIFTELQLQHIRTELAVAAQERATLVETPSNIQQYLCEQAYLRGKMEALQALIATHDNTKYELQQKIAEELEAQRQRGTKAKD